MYYSKKYFLTQQYRLFSNYSASLQMDIGYVILIIHELKLLYLE
jgi:hypothetical protein